MNKARVQSLWIYPVKSMKGIQLSEACATSEGFEHDRRWMLVDDKGTFMTQREHAQLALFECQLEHSSLIVSYEGDSIDIPLNYRDHEIINVNLWQSSFKAGVVSKEINSWFSERLNIDLRFVQMLPEHKRRRSITKSPYRFDVGMADGYPYLVLSMESVDLLNSKLENSVDINRFRANIIVSGVGAHGEDGWNEYSIGDAFFKNIKPCPRCVVVTIDQESGEKGVEPLATMSKYRKQGRQVMFGVNAVCIKEGILAAGDTINNHK